MPKTYTQTAELILKEMQNIDLYFLEKFGFTLSESDELLSEIAFVANDDGKFVAKNKFLRVARGALNKLNKNWYRPETVDDMIARRARKNADKYKKDGSKKTRQELDMEAIDALKKSRENGGSEERNKLQTYSDDAVAAAKARKEYKSAKAAKTTADKKYTDKEKDAKRRFGRGSAAYYDAVADSLKAQDTASKDLEAAKTKRDDAKKKTEKSYDAAAEMTGGKITRDPAVSTKTNTPTRTFFAQRTRPPIGPGSQPPTPRIFYANTTTPAGNTGPSATQTTRTTPAGSKPVTKSTTPAGNTRSNLNKVIK